MQALWIEDKEPSLRSVENPVAENEECLLDILLAGICGTDLELIKGYYDFTGIPGHEFVAIVVSGPEALLGKRVVVDINLGCGSCLRCRMGIHKHCIQRKVIGIKEHPGAFAEQVVAPADNLLVVGDDIPDWQAVLVEPLAAAIQILEQVQLNENSRVLIVGAGRLGKMIARVLRTLVDDLSVCVRTKIRRNGFDDSVMIVEPDGMKADFDCVIDCTGTEAGLEAALNAVKPKGQLVVKSAYRADISINMNKIVVNEIELIGSRCGSMGTALNWLTEDKVTFPNLTRVEYALTDFMQAFKDAEDKAIEKVYLAP